MWGACSPICGDSRTRMRSRTQMRDPANGGTACNGDAEEDETCNAGDPCPGMKASSHYRHISL